jgi:hypothetical protein
VVRPSSASHLDPWLMSRVERPGQGQRWTGVPVGWAVSVSPASTARGHGARIGRTEGIGGGDGLLSKLLGGVTALADTADEPRKPGVTMPAAGKPPHRPSFPPPHTIPPQGHAPHCPGHGPRGAWGGAQGAPRRAGRRGLPRGKGHPDGDVDVSARVEGSYHDQYDQAGAMVWIGRSHWLKAGVELYEGRPRLSTVVTLGCSSWAPVKAPVGRWCRFCRPARTSRPCRGRR